MYIWNFGRISIRRNLFLEMLKMHGNLIFRNIIQPAGIYYLFQGKWEFFLGIFPLTTLVGTYERKEEGGKGCLFFRIHLIFAKFLEFWLKECKTVIFQIFITCTYCSNNIPLLFIHEGSIKITYLFYRFQNKYKVPKHEECKFQFVSVRH